VLDARDGDALRMRTALEALCRTYWYPLYAFVRARGYSSHDAEDLTQAFFHRLIEKNGLRHVHPAKGRFRHFLLASIKHFLANEWDRARTLKRGGNHQVISLDLLQAAERHAAEYSDACGPDVL
jgi:RNA polymerase sigma-70 factor (ECF subfamily)